MKIEVSYEVDMPDLWLTECVSGSGRWARRHQLPDGAGWVLRAVDEETDEHAAGPVIEALGVGLPRGWYHLDPALAFRKGCERYGAAWFDDPRTDATRYDVAVQLATLGEVRYG